MSKWTTEIQLGDVLAEKHVVTGGAGFLGARTVSLLLERGHHVVSVDRFRDPGLSSDVEQIIGDVRDRSLVRKAFRGISVVHHHAALVPLTRAYNDFWSVNVHGSQLVAEEARRAGVKALMHTSSSAVFGETENRPIRENHPLAPVEPYGRPRISRSYPPIQLRRY